MVPLSEREQQILDQLEKELHGSGTTTTERPSRGGDRYRGLKLGVVVFVVGILLLAWFFVSKFILIGAASFAAMVGGIVMGATSIRAEIGKGGGAGERIARAVGGWEEAIRRRHRRD